MQIKAKQVTANRRKSKRITANQIISKKNTANRSKASSQERAQAKGFLTRDMIIHHGFIWFYMVLYGFIRFYKVFRMLSEWFLCGFNMVVASFLFCICFSLLFNAFTMIFPCFFYTFRCFPCVSWLFLAFTMLFNAFRCLNKYVLYKTTYLILKTCMLYNNTNPPFLIAPITQATLTKRVMYVQKHTFAWNHRFISKAELVACFVCISKMKLRLVETAKHGTLFCSAQTIFYYYLIPATSPNKTNPEWSSCSS